MAFFRGHQGTVKFDKDASGATSEVAAIRSWSASLTKESLLYIYYIYIHLFNIKKLSEVSPTLLTTNLRHAALLIQYVMYLF